MNECIPKPILSKLPPIATNGAHPLCATKHFIVPLPVPLRLGQWDLTSKYIISHFLQAITEIFLPPYTHRHSTGFKQGGRAEQPNGPRHSQLSLPGWFPHKTKWNSKIRHPFSIPTPQENIHMHHSRNSRHQEKITQLHSYTPTCYTECIYTGDTDTTIKNIKQDTGTLENTITQCGAVPVFCTITHMNTTH